jgi:hypothetical protein
LTQGGFRSKAIDLGNPSVYQLRQRDRDSYQMIDVISALRVCAMDLAQQLELARADASEKAIHALQLQCILDAKNREINILRAELSNQVGYA